MCAHTTSFNWALAQFSGTTDTKSQRFNAESKEVAEKDLAVEMKSFTENAQHLGKRGCQQRTTQFDFEPKDAKAELTAFEKMATV